MRRDRLPDGQPAGTGYTDPGTVLGRDVARRAEVGVQAEPARPTDEQRSGPAVVPRRVTTAGALLRGQPGIDPGHRTTASFGLIPDELADLGERPAVYAPRVRTRPG